MSLCQSSLKMKKMKLVMFVCYLTFLSVYCFPVNGVYKDEGASKSRTEMEVDNGCTEKWCETYSFSEIERMYRGLFLSELEFFLQQLLFYLDRDIILYREGVRDFDYIVGSDGDGDSCCVTKHIAYRNDTLQNVMGVTRRVVHLTWKNKYQYITQARCIGVGSCDGICVLEDTVRTVLVYDRQSVTFDQVLVPSYCSCKRADNKK
ncbi:uncharacterized protein LOC123532183 [Mercenaria mercenaria]|uniref:uncharacterized protein LOC123532183 n=1 Tax=Mercenaria mercenaria TaxID=6596 RepID=UPI00234EFEEF|nr:uncharacterized protein LOC123532183 [Mercenaria mercenaria]